MLDKIYDSIKESFQATIDACLGTDKDTPYAPAEEITVEKVQDVVDLTNKEVTDAADDNIRPSIQAASRRSNLLMSIARDNYSATNPRLNHVRNYIIYLERATYEGSSDDEKDSDGMLLANIKRVDL